MQNDMNTDFDTIASTKEWWRNKRLKYNKGLIVAGISAFICYCVAFELVADKLGPEVEITIFTTLFQGIGYLIMMGIANICYNLDPFVERKLKPKNIGQYRRTAFSLGFWGSVALPFIVPVLLLVG